MPVTLSEKPIPFDNFPNRIRWTVRQCGELRDAGFLADHYELVDGEIISRVGQGPRHAYVVNLIMAWLTATFGAARVRIQSTLKVSESDEGYDAPEPDAALTVQPASAYIERHPGPEDTSLIVEASDSSARFDRVTKAMVYGRAGIQEYWVVDIVGRLLYVHRRPTHEGFSDVVAYEANESVAPLASPGTAVSVANLLPPTG